MRAAIGPVELGLDEILHRVAEHPKMSGLDLTSTVTPAEPYRFPAVEAPRFRVGVYESQSWRCQKRSTAFCQG